MFFVGAILRWAVLVGYLACAFLYIASLARNRVRGREWASPFLMLTVGLHALLLVETAVEQGRLAFLRTALQATTLYAMVLAASTLIVEARARNRAYGAFVVPIAAVLYGLSLVQRTPHAGIDPLLDSNWFEAHVMSAFVGYALFCLAFVAAVMYLTLAGVIHRRRLGTLFARMPSLESLDQLQCRAVTFGFIFFTGALITGAIWARQATGAFWSGELKEIMSVVTWGVFAVYLAARFKAGWRGRRAALVSIVGFAVSIVTFLGAGGAGRHL